MIDIAKNSPFSLYGSLDEAKRLSVLQAQYAQAIATQEQLSARVKASEQELRALHAKVDCLLVAVDTLLEALEKKSSAA